MPNVCVYPRPRRLMSDARAPKARAKKIFGFFRWLKILHNAQKTNIVLNARAHECLVFARAPGQKGIKAIRERRRRERRKFWGFLVAAGQKKHPKMHPKPRMGIFPKKFAPPHFSQKWGGRPTFEIHQPPINGGAMKHCQYIVKSKNIDK